jgi:hypothetical protein
MSRIYPNLAESSQRVNENTLARQQPLAEKPFSHKYFRCCGIEELMLEYGPESYS